MVVSYSHNLLLYLLFYICPIKFIIADPEFSPD